VTVNGGRGEVERMLKLAATQLPLAVPDVLGRLYFVRLQVSRLYQVMNVLVSGCTVIICRLRDFVVKQAKIVDAIALYYLRVVMAGTRAIYFWVCGNLAQGSTAESCFQKQEKNVCIHIERVFDETSRMCSIVFDCHNKHNAVEVGDHLCASI
jgi:hypothetical protein